MAFVNGFPTEDDIKLPLYTVEPEQLSDLLFPQISYALSQITRNITDFSINFPFQYGRVSTPSGCGFLWQRYNPYGLTFADEYSTKLYQFYQKYYLLKFVDYTAINLPKLLYTFAELKVILPNNNLRLDISYYYPEYPENIADIEALRDTGNDFYREGSEVIYQRINNDCMTSPHTRSWLLNFETHFCQGQEITIREDILVNSLVITFASQATESQKDEIYNLFPSYYLYKNINTFFADLDSLIAADSNLKIDDKIATRVTYKFRQEYSIKHIGDRNLTNTSEGLQWHINPDNCYQVEHQLTYLPPISSDFVDYPEYLKLGALIYANNNNWNNYDFSHLTDLGSPVDVYKEGAIDDPQTNNIAFSLEGSRYILNTPANLPIELNFTQNSNVLINPDNTYKSVIPFTLDFNLSLNQIFGASQPYFFLNVLEIQNQGGFNWIDEQFSDWNNNNEIDTESQSFIDANEYYGSDSSLVQSGYINAYTSIKTRDSYTPFSMYSPNFRRLYDSVSNIPFVISACGNCLEVQDNGSNRDVNRVYFANIEAFKIDVDLTSNTPTFHPDSEKNYNILTSRFDKDASIGSGFTELTNYLLLANQEILPSIYQPRLRLFYSLTRGNNGFHPIVNQTGTNEIQIPVTFTIASSLKPFQPHQDYQEVLDFILLAKETCYDVANCDLEDLKKQVKEIHLTLHAAKYAYLDGSTQEARVANVGYYIERIARVLGISVNDDGSIRSIRQSKLIDKGDKIPAGWNIGQWGRNQGGSSQGQTGGNPSEDRDGLVYEVRSNKFTNDDFTGDTNRVEQGGYVCCENLPQYLHIMMNDLDKALGLQDAGANVIPAPDGSIVPYQGMNTMLLDLLYSLSQMSRNTSGTHILALKNQAIAIEILAAFGLPTTVKELEINTDGQAGILPYPGLEKTAPNLTDLQFWILQNLGLLVGNKLNVEPTPEEQTQP